MSIAGNFNVLVGKDARLPMPGRDNQIVIGTSGETIYLGGAGVSSAGGVIVAASGITLSGTAVLTVSGNAGVLGQVLTSDGAASAPYWGPPLPVTLLTSVGSSNAFVPRVPLASLYTVSGATPGPTALNANWSLTLPAPSSATGTGVWLKNAASASGTVATAGTAVVNLGGVEPHAAVVMQQGNSGLFQSDGTLWIVQSANTTFATMG
jgi:hypothetical protein